MDACATGHRKVASWPTDLPTAAAVEASAGTSAPHTGGSVDQSSLADLSVAIALWSNVVGCARLEAWTVFWPRSNGRTLPGPTHCSLAAAPLLQFVADTRARRPPGAVPRARARSGRPALRFRRWLRRRSPASRFTLHTPPGRVNATSAPGSLTSRPLPRSRRPRPSPCPSAP